MPERIPRDVIGGLARSRRGDPPGGQGARAAVADYKTARSARLLFLAGILVLFTALAAVDLGIGSYSVSIAEVYAILLQRTCEALTGIDPEWVDDTVAASVVWNQRLPRILVAVISGAGLAVAGAAMQSMLKNPLADPYTTGISSGAAFGATIAMTLGVFIIPGNAGVVVNAFVFGLVPAGIILVLSRFRRPSPAMMILAGTSLMFVLNAVQQFLMLVADPNSSQQVLSWTTGSITSCTWDEIPIMAAITIAGMSAVLYLAKALNAMNSGDTYARSLGVDVNRVRVATLMIVSLLAAGIVSFTGIIGFVGLVAPHIARLLIGSDNRHLVPASALMGAVLMLFADIVAHRVVSFDLPIGIVTAIIGGPVFLLLIMRQRKEVW